MADLRPRRLRGGFAPQGGSPPSSAPPKPGDLTQAREDAVAAASVNFGSADEVTLPLNEWSRLVTAVKEAERIVDVLTDDNERTSE